MTQDEIDILWQQAMRQSIEDGEKYIRYHFAKLVAAKEREACANLCWKNEDDNAFVNQGGKRLDLLCAELIKARGEA